MHKSRHKGLGYFSSDDIVNIYKRVQRQLKSPLEDDAMQLIINKAKRVERKYFETMGKNTIINRLVNDITNVIKNHSNPHVINSQEVYVEQIGRNQEGGQSHSNFHLDEHGDPLTTVERKHQVSPLISIQSIAGCKSV